MSTRRSIAVLMNAAANERTLFTNGVIEFYTASQPASASNPITGTLIGIATLNGAAFTDGNPANGLTMAAPVIVNDTAVLSKPTNELWQFKAVAAGTISSARYKANAHDSNEQSTTAMRLDMSVSGLTGNGDAKMAKLTYAINEVGDIQSLNLIFSNPVSA